MSGSPLAGLLRTRILAHIAALAMSFEKVQKIAFSVVSQIAIHYRQSALSQATDAMAGSAPHAGDRFPWLHITFEPGGAIEDLFQKLDDTRLNLIVVGQPAPAEVALGLGDLLRIHAIPEQAGNDSELTRARIPTPSFYLVRPDGHVGLCGARVEVDALKRYFEERLTLGSRGR